MNSEIEEQIRSVEDKFLVLTSERNKSMEKLESLKRDRENCIARMEICGKAIEFVEQVSTQERQNIKKRIESLITNCLHSVFGDEYGVEFDYGMKRNRTSVEINALHECEDGMVVKRGIDGIGGGLADMISLPLKLIVLLNDDGLERIFVVDEPGKHLSVNLVPKFAEFLKQISRKLNVQIIMSSHHTCMDEYADCVNEVSLEGSESHIERIK